MRAAHNEHRTLEGSIGARGCRIFDQGMKIEWPLGCPADQSALRRWTHSLPCTDTTPIIDEPSKSSAIITGENSISDLPRNTGDFRERLGAKLTQLSQQVECRRLVEHHARDLHRASATCSATPPPYGWPTR